MEKSIKFSEHVLRKNIFIEDNDPYTTKTKSLNPKTIRPTVTYPYATDSSEDENKSVVVKRVKKHVTKIKIKRKRKKKSTKYRGLYQSPSGKWVAQIRDTLQKKTIWLGTYNTAIEAALAYDEAAVKLKEAHHAVTTLKKSTRLEKKYRGVTMRPSRKWGAYIQDQGKYFWLGTFDTAEEATMVHDKAALRLKRSLAVINFPSVAVSPVSVVASNEDAFGNGFGDMHEPEFGDGFDLPEFGRYRFDEFGQFHIG